MKCSNCGCYYVGRRCPECSTPSTENINDEKEGR